MAAPHYRRLAVTAPRHHRQPPPHQHPRQRIRIMQRQQQHPVVNVIPSLPVATTAPGTGSDQVLVMLLPASSVRWGKSWGDSSERTMDWMLNNYYSSQHDDVSSEYRTSHNATDDMWLEIGCSVFRAQLVKNVTFSS